MLRFLEKLHFQRKLCYHPAHETRWLKRGSLPGLKRESEVAKLIFECVGPGCRIISVEAF